MIAYPICMFLHCHNIQVFFGANQEMCFTYDVLLVVDKFRQLERYLLWSFDELHPSDSLTSSALIKGISASFSFSASSSSNNLSVWMEDLELLNCGWKAIESWMSSPGFTVEGANHQHRGCLWSEGLQSCGTLFVHQLDFSGILPDQRQQRMEHPHYPADLRNPFTQLRPRSQKIFKMHPASTYPLKPSLPAPRKPPKT